MHRWLTGTGMLCWGHCVRAWIDKTVTTWQHEVFLLWVFFFYLKSFSPSHVLFLSGCKCSEREMSSHEPLRLEAFPGWHCSRSSCVSLQLQLFWSCLNYLPHVTWPTKCGYTLAVFGGSFHLGYLYYFIKEKSKRCSWFLVLPSWNGAGK